MAPGDIPQIPMDQTITCTLIIINYQPQKRGPNHVGITIDGNLLNYPGKLTACMAKLDTGKILWNALLEHDAYVPMSETSTSSPQWVAMNT